MTRISTTQFVRPLWPAGLLAVVWLVAAAVRPALTFHLAPVLIAGSVPLLLANDGATSQRFVVFGAFSGFALALGTTVVISTAGWMQGPSLLPFGGPAVEALVFAVGGAVLGGVSAMMRPREAVEHEA